MIILIGGVVVGAASLMGQATKGKVPADTFAFNDSHFHSTNYIQRGTEIHRFLQIMGTTAGRVALFGIPLQQTWAYSNSGTYAPTYYLQSDAPLYYYSFTDAFIAMSYLSLTKQSKPDSIR